MNPLDHPNIRLPLTFEETPIAVIDGVLVTTRGGRGYLYTDTLYLGTIIDGDPYGNIRSAVSSGVLSESTFATIKALLQLHR